MTEDEDQAKWNVTEWHGRMLVDRNGEKIGKLQDVYVDVETDEPQFGTVKEGFIGRHLTFVPLSGIQIGPDDLQATVTKDQVRSAPDIELHGEELSQEDESALYHHFEMNYIPIITRAVADWLAAESCELTSTTTSRLAACQKLPSLFAFGPALRRRSSRS